MTKADYDLTLLEQLFNSSWMPAYNKNNGSLLCSIIHEVNQPINVASNYIDGGLNYLEQQTQPLMELVSALKLASKQTQQAGQLMHSLKDFLCHGKNQKKPLNINHLLQESVQLLGIPLRQSSIETQLSLAENLPIIAVEKLHLQQAFFNIINNAIDALQEVGNRQLYISTKVFKNAIEIRITDNANGIPSEIQDALFDAFITSKAKGTGIGLSITKQIIKQGHQGDIWVESVSGKGSCFVIILPITE